MFFKTWSYLILYMRRDIVVWLTPDRNVNALLAMQEKDATKMRVKIFAKMEVKILVFFLYHSFIVWQMFHNFYYAPKIIVKSPTMIQNLKQNIGYSSILCCYIRIYLMILLIRRYLQRHYEKCRLSVSAIIHGTSLWGQFMQLFLSKWRIGLRLQFV